MQAILDVSYPKKTKLKIHWMFITDFVQNSDKFKDHLLLSTIAFTADLHFLYLHINRALKAIDVFTGSIFVFNFFYPEVKKSKTLSICYKCPFANFIDIANIQLLLTAFKTTTGLPVDITWPLEADNGLIKGVAVSILTVSGYFVLLRTS